ncbi:MAG TPA: endonuclease [Dehalococcoidia bacterium]|nr:endonuclease [Dehalococcoidia bacterium]
MRDTGQRLLAIYQRLLGAYGPQGWWPGETPFEVIVGAILTQSAAWTNVEKAIANLKAAGALSPQGLRDLDEGELARLVYPSGYFNHKARKLKAFVALLFDRFGGDLDRLLAIPAPQLRSLLLATYGIGPETADSIILYAAGQPLFVIDAYTRRVFDRLGISPRHDDYDSWQRMFQQSLPADAALFNQYHALIVRHGKDTCRRKPLCAACPLNSLCPAAIENAAFSGQIV